MYAVGNIHRFFLTMFKNTKVITSLSKALQQLALVMMMGLFCHSALASEAEISESNITENNIAESSVEGNVGESNIEKNTSNKIRVLLVNPSIENDPFWHKIEKITKQAATELNIDLAIIYGHGTRFFQLDELKKYFEHNPVPDYIVLLNYPGHAKLTMDFLQQQQVKVITLEQTIAKEEKTLIGTPGNKYKNWLGEIYFNNSSAGHMLAKSLINMVKSANKKPIVAGISGHFGSESSLRNSGLQKAIKESGAQLTQIVHAGWSAEDAYQKTIGLLKRYPNINIIWCASDHMALAVVDAIEDSGKVVGVDILVGGFDWTPKAIISINNNKLTASIGGHFMMGAMAIMAIYNEEQGISHNVFVNEHYNSFELALISKKNISEYIHLLQSETLTQVSFKELVQLYSTRAGKSSGNLLEMLEKTSLKKSNINH
ncbi:MAG: ABC transporter substrate-binding protein [Colwellia sp.]|uniref:ABC transporter substrate-binding protein n=1 Tax=Colwellia sp. TaxID=56799 RepID=UPI0025C4AFB5|nr:ABC transporter substrate-binding protein [Colwellia sp.]NQZ24759.1 ABC transporter substrate-binding protein [Colwellia sp.]